MYRITADLDTNKPLSLMYSLMMAQLHVEDIKQLHLIKSTNNYHLIIWTSKYHKKAQQYKLRQLIGDDPNRIKIDKLKRPSTEQTLFYKKITTPEYKEWKKQKK